MPGTQKAGNHYHVKRWICINVFCLIGAFHAACVADDTYVDSAGTHHAWHITTGHTLNWDGQPYIPFGGMFVSQFLHDPSQKAYEHDRDALERIRQAGVDDLYLNPGRVQIPENTQKIIDLFERLGFRYGLQSPITLGAEQSGYVVNSGAGQLMVGAPGEASIKIKLTLAAAGSTVQARYIVVGRRRGEFIDAGTLSAPLVDAAATFSVKVSVVPPGGALVKIVPALTIRNWIADDASGLIGWLKPLKLGPGLRFILDPYGNEYSPPRNFLPTSKDWREAFSAWLTVRYKSPAKLAKAWGLGRHVPKDFNEAAMLVPFVVGPGGSKWSQRGFAVDDESGKFVALDLTVSRIWLDIVEARDEFLRDRIAATAEQIRSVVDVPIVVKRHHESTRIWINRRTDRGIDGLGMESYGVGDELARFNGAATYADVAQSRRPTWCLVTEFNASHWSDRHIGYLNRTQMYHDLNLLLSLGARGVFMFGLQLASSPQDAQWSIFELDNNPAELEWLATFGQAARARSDWTGILPDSAFAYPVENTEIHDFIWTGLPNYGLSGSWKGVRSVLPFGAHRWLAPVFYPDGLPLVLYSPVVMHAPILAHEANILRAGGLGHFARADLGGAVHIPKEWINRYLNAPSVPVDIKVSEIAPDVESVSSITPSGEPIVSIRALKDSTLVEVDAKLWHQAEMLFPGESRFQTVSLPQKVRLPAPAREIQQFRLVNHAFDVRDVDFIQAVGLSPDPLIIKGVPADQIVVRAPK